MENTIESVELGYMEANNKPTAVTLHILRSHDNRLCQNGKTYK